MLVKCSTTTFRRPLADLPYLSYQVDGRNQPAAPFIIHWSTSQQAWHMLCTPYMAYTGSTWHFDEKGKSSATLEKIIYRSFLLRLACKGILSFQKVFDFHSQKHKAVKKQEYLPAHRPSLEAGCDRTLCKREAVNHSTMQSIVSDQHAHN